MELALAILGVIGTLTGTALGAVLNARTSAQIEARRAREKEMRRRQEIRAAARLVHTELGAAELAAASDAKNRSVTALSALSPDAWTTYRGLLAGELPDAAYDTVADACVKVLLTVTVAGQITTLDDDLPAELFDTTLPEMHAVLRRARATLAPVAYPDFSGDDVSAD